MDNNRHLDNNVEQYINQLSEVERIILKTAQQQLESSFDIFKSIGYLEWSLNKDK